MPWTTSATVWCVDFEFRTPDGERPEPLCMVAREWRTGDTLRVWADELESMFVPPFPVGPTPFSLPTIASAELGCFQALGWPMPARVLDLFCEFRNITNGSGTISGNGLLGALARFGLRAIDAAEKGGHAEPGATVRTVHRSRAAALLAYCETDVDALTRLLPAMLPQIDLPARPSQGPLHGRRCGDGMERRSYRRSQV